ncbi:MAG: hypothetical protein FWF08_05280 [Oscillospiraceae bacterium]|nr:hypothetical protein [Oscillospiraceae bacterium]
MYTRLRKGFIWDFLESAEDCGIVEKDEGFPCRPFNLYDGEKPLLRVLYKNNEVRVECTHLTCDGVSVSKYLNSLLARYFNLQGYEIEKSVNILRYDDKPEETELDDYFYRAAEEKPQKKNLSMIDSPAFLYLRERKPGYLQVVKILIPIDSLKNLIKEKYGSCTITEYLGAVYASAFLQLYEKEGKEKKPVRLAVPCDLRHFWDTNTLRNFIGGGRIEIKPDKNVYDFMDVLGIVRREMKKVMAKETQHAFVYASVRYLELFIMKLIPDFAKKFALASVAPRFEQYRWMHTSTLSNIGYIKLPPSLADHILNYMFLLGEMEVNRIACAVAGVGNILTVAFSAVNESTEIQDFCVGFFKKDGLPVEVKTVN